MMTLRLLLAALFLCWVPLSAQHRVDPRNMYERALCVVPMVGAGTPDDPRRPQYAPLPPTPGPPASREGIVAFTYQISDDGKFALAEFVAYDRKAFKELLSDANIQVFIKGKDKKQDIEAAFKKLKKDVNLSSFWVVVP